MLSPVSLPDLSPRRVALLEDDSDAAACIASTLRQCGFEVSVYAEAAQFERASQTRSFSAYVLPWYLGSTNAAALIEALRLRPSSAFSPIFLLTAGRAVGSAAADELLADIVEKHRVQLVAKPYSTFRLASDLRRGLAESEA
jgi:DNA-binding response OmpR family regulator